MRDLALVMIKPDGVYQGLTGAVLAFLAERGFTALASTSVQLTSKLRSHLYATTRTVGRLDWDLNAVLYSLGPVTAVQLRGPAVCAEDAGAAAYLSAKLKGHFVPTRARPGTIRGSLNSMNPIFNLVHASDNEAELRREVPALFGRGVTDVVNGEEAALSEQGRPLQHWQTVGDTLAEFLVPGGALAAGRNEQAWRILDDAGWPDPETGRRAGFEAVRRARRTVLAATRHNPTATAAGLPALIAGAEPDLPGIDDVFTAAAALPRPPSKWHTYLAYTSLRYLDLCLETPHEQ